MGKTKNIYAKDMKRGQKIIARGIRANYAGYCKVIYDFDWMNKEIIHLKPNEIVIVVD